MCATLQLYFSCKEKGDNPVLYNEQITSNVDLNDGREEVLEMQARVLGSGENKWQLGFYFHHLIQVPFN